MRTRAILFWSLLMGGTAYASPPPPRPSPALVPRAQATGFSTIEQAYRYAPPNEGVIEFPLTLGAGPGELAIETPGLCAADQTEFGQGKIRFKYSKSRNKVEVDAWMQNLPYRPTMSRPDDPSTPFNQWPLHVVDGRWQLWFMGGFNVSGLFYYDGLTGELLGHENDLPGGPPANAIPVPIPGTHILCSPLFDGKDNGITHVHFEYAYNAIIDDEGTGGTFTSYVPPRLCAPDELIPYYTDGGLPVSQALSFDDWLLAIHQGFGIGVATSLEPFPKPAYLKARDNIMIAHVALYPSGIPVGYQLNITSQELETRQSCETHIVPKLPGAYWDFCGP